MKVLFVTNMYPTAERPSFGIFVARQAAALREAGVDVAVEPIAGHRRQPDYFLARRRIAAAVRRERPDLIHCHYGYSPIAAAFQGLPFVVTLCGDDLNGESDGAGDIRFKSRLGIVVSQAFAARAARVIVVSNAMQSLLWAHTRARSEVLPYGIDDRLFSMGSRSEARRRLGLSEDGLVLSFVNSCRQRTKRLDVARATAAELVRRGVATHLLVADDVPADDMPWYYRAANCLIMTSEREGTPNCVLESLACGVPVVSVPIGDLSMIVDAPARGRVVPRDPAVLADTVLELCASSPVPAPGLLPARFRADTITSRLVELYREILAQ
ncbi:MAG: glycosyltransferase [Gemmatimonadales bacterium]|nr:glycosyltransferase [Gemmatimonadales bacterium]